MVVLKKRPYTDGPLSEKFKVVVAIQEDEDKPLISLNHRNLVTDSPSKAAKWIAMVKRRFSKRVGEKELVVGVQLQIADGDVATIQLLVGRQGLLFQLARAHFKCEPLQEFLADSDIRFITLESSSALAKLAEHGFNIPNLMDGETLVRTLIWAGVVEEKEGAGTGEKRWKELAQYSCVQPSEYMSRLRKGKKWNRRALSRAQIGRTLTKSLCALRLGKFYFG